LSRKVAYIPERGDAVWITLDPQAIKTLALGSTLAFARLPLWRFQKRLRRPELQIQIVIRRFAEFCGSTLFGSSASP
jgi:hypothetical protein